MKFLDQQSDRADCKVAAEDGSALLSLCLSEIESEHIDGAIRRELASAECVQPCWHFFRVG
jgi:hypothetical protein